MTLSYKHKFSINKITSVNTREHKLIHTNHPDTHLFQQL